MQITFINVGYGDAIWVRHGAFHLLIDGGSALPQEFEGCRIRAADFLAAQDIAQIDLLVLTHIHEDHVCGLTDLAARLPIRCIALPYPPDSLPARWPLVPDADAPRSVPLFTRALGAARDLLRMAADRNIPVCTWQAGDVVHPTDGLTIRVLAPTAAQLAPFVQLLRQAGQADNPTEALTALDRTANDSSLVLQVDDGVMTCLLPGDSCPHNWHHIPCSLLENVNVLKLPHHGQPDSISPDLMQKMSLKAVVTTSSSDRRYNSANPAVYRTLHALHPTAQFIFTDERAYPPYFSHPNGAQAVTLRMDSQSLATEFSNMTPNGEKKEKKT